MVANRVRSVQALREINHATDVALVTTNNFIGRIR
jgi:hypothetical protein